MGVAIFGFEKIVKESIYSSKFDRRLVVVPWDTHTDRSTGKMYHNY